MEGTDNFILRRAFPSDINSIVEIISSVVPLMRASGNFQWDESYPQEQHFLNDIGANQLWVAIEAQTGRIVGIGALTTDQPDDYGTAGCDLSLPSIVPHRMAVSPDFRRRGIAGMFLDQAEILAIESGVKIVRIDTNKCNAAMQKLIEKKGYTFMAEISLSGKAEGLRYLCYEKHCRTS
jgi:GNAT superfamily N-acetyltransferase